MKRIIVAITFAMFAFAANANTTIRTKEKTSPKITVKKTVGKNNVEQWEIIQTCGDYVVTVCCFNSYWDAFFFDMNQIPECCQCP